MNGLKSVRCLTSAVQLEAYRDWTYSGDIAGKAGNGFTG